jgi:hypothetical protein
MVLYLGKSLLRQISRKKSEHNLCSLSLLDQTEKKLNNVN